MGARTKKEIEQSEAKPDALAVIPDGVPQALKELGQWIVWKYERRRDQKEQRKWTKIPVNPRTGRNASSNKPVTWSTFQEALTALRNQPAIYSGIGFMFSLEDTFCGVDLDDCYDIETGTVQEWATQVVARLSSYTEVSPSGTGLKIFVRGVLPEGRNRRGPVEMYDRGRYFAVTGHHLAESPPTVEERQVQLEQIQQSLNQDQAQSNGKSQTEERQQTPQYLSDLELIEKAQSAHNGDKFSRLWAGDISGYPSNSEADQALCNMLAFWAGPDSARIDALFRQSGLFREKWEREDYRTETIRKALSGRTEFCSRNGQVSGCASPRAKEEMHLTDTGNARRLVKRHGADIRYCHPWGKWLVWDERRWLQDATAAVTYRAKETIASWFGWAHRKIGTIRKQLKEAASNETEG